MAGMWAADTGSMRARGWCVAVALANIGGGRVAVGAGWIARSAGFFLTPSPSPSPGAGGACAGGPTKLGGCFGWKKERIEGCARDIVVIERFRCRCRGRAGSGEPEARSGEAELGCPSVNRDPSQQEGIE